jgi:hypothetical protein
MKMAVFWVALIALMMEAARTSETLVNFYQTTRCYNPEDSHLHKVRLFPHLVTVRFSCSLGTANTVARFNRSNCYGRTA